MAVIELGGLPIIGGDLTFKNYGVTDIPAGRGVLADTSNLGTSDTPPGVVLPTASGGVVGTLGTTVEIIHAGGVGKVRMLGAYPMTADGAITFGTGVQISDATSKLGFAKTCASATTQLGIAIRGAADGEKVLVWIHVAKNA